VIEPGGAGERLLLFSAPHPARDGEARDRNVVRVVVFSRPLEREAVLAVCDRRLDRGQSERKVPAPAGGVEKVPAARILCRPVFIGDGKAPDGGGSDAREREVYLFLVTERLLRVIAPGKVREAHLAGSEKRELEPVLALAGAAKVPRVVPPLNRRVGMGAVVARERQFRLVRPRRRKRQESDCKEDSHR
jgi:hypothetical protein